MSKKIKNKTEAKVSDDLTIKTFTIKNNQQTQFGVRKKEQKIRNKTLSVSSSAWLRRSQNDKYTQKAKELGYRSRSAFKILEIDKKFNIIKNSRAFLDLGSSPGGWTQVIKQNIPDSQIVCLDLIEMNPVEGAHFILGNFLDEQIKKDIRKISDKFDVILSDIAPNTTGNRETDHFKIMNIANEVLDFGLEFLTESGSLVVKIFQGVDEAKFVEKLRKNFETVNYFKPDSSRKESKEIYLVAKNLKTTLTV